MVEILIFSTFTCRLSADDILYIGAAELFYCR